MQFSAVENRFIVKLKLNSAFTNDLKRKYFFRKKFIVTDLVTLTLWYVNAAETGEVYETKTELSMEAKAASKKQKQKLLAQKEKTPEQQQLNQQRFVQSKLMTFTLHKEIKQMTFKWNVIFPAKQEFNGFLSYLYP